MSTAAGIIATPKELLRGMLADCWYFQEWVREGGDRDAALESIYIDALPLPFDGDESYTAERLIKLRPFAVVQTNGAVVLTGNAETGGFRAEGGLAAVFEQNVSPDSTRLNEEVERDFENIIGQIMCSGDYAKPGLTELAKSVGSEPYLSLRAISSAFEGPQRASQEMIPGQGDHWWHAVELEWGPIA